MHKGLKKFKKLIIIIIVFIIPAAINSWENTLPVSGRLINSEFPINTPGDDYSPSITADGSILLFNSKINGEANHNIFITRAIDGAWNKPDYFHPLNSSFNDETPFITSDGTAIVFASDRILEQHEEDDGQR